MKKNNIMIEIAGGLGNQLFMYYAGLFFGERLNRKVTFDVTDLTRIKNLHPGENIETLGLLKNYETIIKKSSILSKYDLSKKLHHQLNTVWKMISSERGFRSLELGYIDPEKVPLKTDKLSGYFQTWRYFSSLENKNILSVNTLETPTGWFLQKLNELDSLKPIIFHVRRGDYLLPKNRSHGVLSESYYRSVLQFVDPQREVWIFTDSPESLNQQKFLSPHKVTLISPPKDSDPIESLILMSQASEIVISNSTFAWWAAMLSASEVTVYAPSKWFEGRSDPIDLIPDSWIRIKSEWEIQK